MTLAEEWELKYRRIELAAYRLYCSAHWTSDKLSPTEEIELWEDLKKAGDWEKSAPKMEK